MATIKLKEGAVILKDGKVSCSCCLSGPPDFCCPYPAAGLGVLYERNDLPEELTILSSAYDYVLPLTLNESGDNIYEGVATGEGFAPQTYRLRTTVSGYWELEGQSEETGQWFGAQDWSPQECLFWDYSDGDVEWPLAPIPPDGGGGYTYPVDDFADSYTATCTTDTGTTTKTYNRESLCVWRSRTNGEVDGVLFYRSDATQAEANQFGKGRVLWRLSGTGFRSQGDGPYNSPAGFYGEDMQCEVTAN